LELNMTAKALVIAAALLATQQPPLDRYDGSWLDAPVADWKASTDFARGQREGSNPKCDPETRSPRTEAERLLANAGWMFKPRVSASSRNPRRTIEIVRGFRQFDGECRPLQEQAFVFVNDRLIGTLSPNLMHYRSDGGLADAEVDISGEIRARFFRYSPGDSLCCPSRESLAVYSVTSQGNTYVLKLVRVETKSLSVPR
jgi:hypothetical protein